MTLKINLSQIKALPFDFAAEVERFRQAKLDHRSTVGEAAPSAIHPWVEAAIKCVPGAEGQADDFVTDYEPLDDTPPPPVPPTLEQRKLALARQVGIDAACAAEKIVPQLKMRLFSMNYSRATAAAEEDRGPAEVAIIADYKARMKQIEAVNYHAATLESEIHDLTDENIDSWEGTQR